MPTLLLPLPMTETMRATRSHEDYNIFGRLRPGVSLTEAQADIDRIVSMMKQQYPANYPPASGFMISVVPLLQQVVGDVRRSLLILRQYLTELKKCRQVANPPSFARPSHSKSCTKLFGTFR